MKDSSPAKKICGILIALLVGGGTYLGLSHYLSFDGEADTPVTGESSSSELLEEQRNDTLESDAAVQSLLSGAELEESSATEMAASMGMTMKFDDPADLVAEVMQQMAKVDSERDVQDLAKVLGNGAVDAEQLAELKRLFEERRIQFNDAEALELIGELKAGKVSRWALRLDDDTKIQLQTARQKDGTWKIEEVIFPESTIDATGKKLSDEEVKQRDKIKDSRDSLLFSSNFLKELVGQNFEKAREMVNNQTVTDAKIAGLCILFEDGAYTLNKDKPLQAVRVTDEMSAFYANVNAKEGGKAQFSLTTTRENLEQAWQIEEINLDRLLDDYAKRTAGGDVYYTPLVKNPNGGDMLVIYFEFDSDGLTARTKKQLDIVVNLLKLDASKKIRLSGHTDSLGSDQYNQSLSEERAETVKAYLTEKGIQPEQILTEAYGFSKPIRPESKLSTGGDDASARRANRRTEIYLDF